MADRARAGFLNTVFHADLSDAHPGEDYWVVVGDKRIPMVPHTQATRSKLLAQAPHLKSKQRVLTHFAAVHAEVPADKVVRVHLKHSLKNSPDAKGNAGVSHSAIYIPPNKKRLAALKSAGAMDQFGPIDYISTAKSLLFHHPDVMIEKPELAEPILNGYMEEDERINAEINNLASEMRRMGPPTEKSGWARLEPFTPKNPEAGYDGKTTYYMQQPTEQITSKAFDALAPLLIAINNDQRFKGSKWFVQPGESVISRDGAKELKTAARLLKSGAADNWQAAVAIKNTVNGLTTSIAMKDAGKRELEIQMVNTLVRYLGAYIQFFDAKDNALKVSTWKPQNRPFAIVPSIETDQLRYLGMIQPLLTIMGVPVYSQSGELKVTVRFPEDAVKAEVYGSGLGTGDNPWPTTPLIGGLMTGIFNLGVPAFMLGFAVAAQSYLPLYKILKDLGADPKFIAAITALSLAYVGGSSAAQGAMDWRAFSTVAQFVFTQAATKALNWMEQELATKTVENQIPFAGWIMVAINIATGLAQMAQTIVAVSTSPWNIKNTISTSITTKVTLHPDPRNKSFPQGASRTYTVKMIYKDQKRPTVSQVHTVPAGSTDVTLPAVFNDNTLGGEVKFEAEFYVGTWLAGKATTGYVANDIKHVSQIDLYLVQYPVPLDEKSKYSHEQVLTYQNGNYKWTPNTTAPKGTITRRDTRPSGNAIGDWTGITLSQRYGMIGLAWQAAGMGITSCGTGSGGQLYAFQNINIPGTPMQSVKFPSCGFDGQSRLIYDPYPPKFKMENGQWTLDSSGRPVPDPADILLGEYYLDPRPATLPYNQGGGYHLRKIKLDGSDSFNMGAQQQSWGRFAYFPDSVALHPSRLVIGVSAQYHKLQVMTMTGPAADIDMPIARIGCGLATDRDRPGLMFRPVATACAYDGTILVLEDTKSSDGGSVQVVSRISAYDLEMNPVNRFFNEKNQPSPWLYLSNASDYYYLDIAAVGDDQMTYIYVLYYTGTGASPSDYHMAIYQYGKTKPKSNPLVTTDSINVARLTVDMWRTVYTLNFDMVEDGQGNPAGPKGASTGPNGRTVPSVSMWLPPTPKPPAKLAAQKGRKSHTRRKR